MVHYAYSWSFIKNKITVNNMYFMPRIADRLPPLPDHTEARPSLMTRQDGGIVSPAIGH
jgi:hypothetical protein